MSRRERLRSLERRRGGWRRRVPTVILEAAQPDFEARLAEAREAARAAGWQKGDPPYVIIIEECAPRDGEAT